MLRFAFQAVIYETVSFVPITVPEKLDLRLIKDQLKNQPIRFARKFRPIGGKAIGRLLTPEGRFLILGPWVRIPQGAPDFSRSE
jgi:hypothetical protein